MRPDDRPGRDPLEVWAGLECSYVRIGDAFRDQIADTGHDARPEDLDRIAALGIRTLRYPVLWESVAGEGPDREEWGWHDDRLGRLRRLGIRPIAGLIHHGSGPRWASVLDPHFVEAFAAYAGRVARRYPWLDRFTPVNEPLATARFSGLYGHWYPHGRSETVCFRFLVAECRAIAAAMKAIRAVTPKAELVQTEDLGKIFATPQLQYQADYENERRWLSLDLLTGRVTREHRFWRILLDHGVSESNLASLTDEPCIPDLIGIDHYLTSDRFLDHRLELHPYEDHGGNGWDSYVDIAAPWSEAPTSQTGWLPRLMEAWARYGLPLAVTEVHNGCTREEQLRWLDEAWRDAQEARSRGVDIRAVTAWAAFGAVDWNTLLAQRRGHCEPGLFDCRALPPRATALAAAVASLARTGSFQSPSLDRSGWWRRRRSEHGATPLRRLLVLGHGDFAETVARRCGLRGLDIVHERSAPGRRVAGIFWGVVEAGENPENPASATSFGGGPIFRCWQWAHAVHGTNLPRDQDTPSAQLSVTAEPGLDLTSFADACLDLLIDGQEGRVCVVGVGGASLTIMFIDEQAPAEPFLSEAAGILERRLQAAG